MRTLGALLALALAVAVWAPPCATDAKEEKKAAAAGLFERVQDLNLTDEQESKIADLRNDYRPKLQQARKELVGLAKEEVEKIRAVLTEEQQAKLKTLKEERKDHREFCLAHRVANLREVDLTDAEMAKIGEIRTAYRPRIAKAMEALRGTLTDEQRKAREEALKADRNRKQVLEALKLTEEQKEKVQAVGKEVATLVREEMEKVRDVLTEEQQEKLQEFKNELRERVRDRFAHAIANLKDLNVTDEQKAKIAEIRKEYRPRVQEAGNKLRATIKEELEKVVAILKG
jgi:Spy/CpxP family protein refolding chaperone